MRAEREIDIRAAILFPCRRVLSSSPKAASNTYLSLRVDMRLRVGTDNRSKFNWTVTVLSTSKISHVKQNVF